MKEALLQRRQRNRETRRRCENLQRRRGMHRRLRKLLPLLVLPGVGLAAIWFSGPLHPGAVMPGRSGSWLEEPRQRHHQAGRPSGGAQSGACHPPASTSAATDLVSCEPWIGPTLTQLAPPGRLADRRAPELALGQRPGLVQLRLALAG